MDLLLADTYVEATWNNSVPGWHILLRGYFQTGEKKRIKIFPPWISTSLSSCNTFALLARLETPSGQNVSARNRTENELSANRYHLITGKGVISLTVNGGISEGPGEQQCIQKVNSQTLSTGLNFWHLLYCWALASLLANTGCLTHLGLAPCEFTTPVVPTSSFLAAHS